MHRPLIHKGPGLCLIRREQKCFRKGKFSPSEKLLEWKQWLGKEKPSTGKREPGCGLEMGWGNWALCNWKYILKQGQATCFKLFFSATSPGGLHFRAQQSYEVNPPHLSPANSHVSLPKEWSTSGHGGPSGDWDGLGQGWIHSPLASSLQPRPWRFEPCDIFASQHTLWDIYVNS